MSFFNESCPEGGHADLGNGAVIDDLTANVLHVYDITDVRLEKQIFSLGEAVVDAVVVYNV
jgi:hypothetical protein